MCALRVIFLDVDGVLHPLGANHLPLGANIDDLSARIDEQQLEANETSATYVTRTLRGVEFLDEHLAQLRRIVTATGAEIVLTTTWRQQGCDRRAVLRRCGLLGVTRGGVCHGSAWDLLVAWRGDRAVALVARRW